MNRDGRTRPRRNATHFIAAFSVFLVCLSVPSGAKLFSTKAQEEKMVSKAVEVAEKWNHYCNDTYGSHDRIAAEIKPFRDAAVRYGDGVLYEMAVLNDMVRLYFHAQRGDEKSYCAMDEFDDAAEMLCDLDRERYYTAKAMLRSLSSRPVNEARRMIWYSLLVNDWSRASRFGRDSEEGISSVRRFVQRNKLNNIMITEAACRIRYEYAFFLLAKAKSLHARNDDKEAFKVAVRGIARIPAKSNLDSGACNKWRNNEALLSAYDSLFIQPLSQYAGRYRQELVLETCKRYWQHKRLVARIAPRVTAPTREAFDLFKRVGKDDVLKRNASLAAAELSLWKKAGKVDAFKKKYPERYRLASRTSSR